MKHDGARCCDIGCGNGKLLDMIHETGCEDTIGIDPDPDAREVASGKGHCVLEGTAEEMPETLEPHTFDLVTSMHSLEHTLHPIQAIANMARLLRPGGSLIVEVPNNQAIGLALTRATWRWLGVPRHLNFFSTKSLHLACESAGLHVEKTNYRGYSRQFGREWLEKQRRAHELMSSRSHAEDVPTYSALSPLKLLLKSALAPARTKYDSVRVLAKRNS